MPDDPCFLLGNYRLTLFAHGSGRYQLITGERAWARLNHGGKNQGYNQSILRVAPGDTLGDAPALPLCGPEATPSVVRTARIFGVGYARYTYQAPHHLIVTKELAVASSPALHTGNSAFLATVTLRNTGPLPLAIVYREELVANYTQMNDQDDAWGSAPSRRVGYPNRLSVNPAKTLAQADIAFKPVQLLVPPNSPEKSYTHDIAPPLLFLHAAPCPGAHVSAKALRTTCTGDLLQGEATLALAPGESRVLRFVIGFSFERDPALIDRQIADLLALPSHPKVGADATAHAPRLGTRVFFFGYHATWNLLSPEKVWLETPATLSDDAILLSRLVQIAATGIEGLRRPSQRALVVGAGLIGLFAAQTLQARGCPFVVVQDIVPARLELARCNGLARTALAEGAGLTAARSLFGTEAPDCVIEATGLASMVGPCLGAVATNGDVSLLGIPRGESTLNLYRLVVRKNAALLGAHEGVIPDRSPTGHSSRQALIQEALDGMVAGRIRTEGLVSGHACPQDCQAFYENLSRDKTRWITAVLDWS